MNYTDICKGIFLERPNRFVAIVNLNGHEVIAHVKNTGRCKELLVSGATVYLEDFRCRMGTRKLEYSLIAVQKGGLLINMDSQAPNKVALEALEEGTLKLPGMGRLSSVQPEKKYGNSRLDFYVEDIHGKKGLIEVKGVTLEKSGVAMFPDAPTERGVKHIRELVAAAKHGYRAYVLFVITMEGMNVFKPNDDTHKAFGDALREARGEGVTLLASECRVTPDTLKIGKDIKIEL